MKPAQYNPETAPVLDLIGYGYRPAWMPADYIGPRLDCPMWVPGPDADLAYSKFDPFEVVEDLGMGEAMYTPLAISPIPTEAFFTFKEVPPCCNPGPELAVVSVPASGLLMLACIAAFMVCRTLCRHDHPGSGWVGHDSQMPKGGYKE